MKYKRSQSQIFPVILGSLFFIGLLVVIQRHEMWRDELQAWLIARDSASLPILFKHVEYEGTPPLWHVCLWILKHFTHNPVIMQFFNAAIGGLLIFLFSTFSPLTLFQKVCLALNYYLVYQYGVIARSYMMSLFFLTLVCVFYRTRHTKPLPLFGAIVLSSLCSVHSLIISIAFACAWTYDVHIHAEASSASVRSDSRKIFLCLFLSLTLITIWMIPPKYAIFPTTHVWHFRFDSTRFIQLAATYMNAFLIVPDFSPRYWTVSFWDKFQNYQIWKSLLGGLVWGLSVFVLRRKKDALIFFLVASIGLAAFFYLKAWGTTRHHGFWVFSFFFALWIKGPSELTASDRVGRWMVNSFLLTQMLGIIPAIRYDWIYPFSNGPAVARYLKDHHLDNQLLATNIDFLAAPIAGHLNSSFYFPHGNRWGTFTKWDQQRLEEIDTKEFYKRIETQMEERKTNGVLILNYELKSPRSDIAFLASFEGSLEGLENYYLYKFSRTNKLL